MYVIQVPFSILVRCALGSGGDWHEARALALAKSLEGSAPGDFVIDTDGRSVTDIADEIVGCVAWVPNG